MQTEAVQPSVADKTKGLFARISDELYGTPERARASIGLSFLALVMLYMHGYIGQSAQIPATLACGF